MDRRLVRWAVLAVLSTLLVPFTASAFDDADAERVLAFARSRLEKTADSLPAGLTPKASRPDGTWVTIKATDQYEWVQGFLPGLLWFMHDTEPAGPWRARAEKFLGPIEHQKDNRATHDLGFKMFLAFYPAWKVTGDEKYRRILLDAATSLASRYDERAAIVNCCDWNPNWRLPLAIDTMMNLELLLWGAQNGGNPDWQRMALNHALTNLRDAVRPDGGTYHIVDYDPATGQVRRKQTLQGFADESTWARGQAWAIYGYTMVYRYTRDPRMLDAARRVTEYYLARLPPDLIPNWDFDAPQQQKDSSAAAVVASALLELSGYVDSPARERYLDVALRTLEVLSSRDYLAEGTNDPGILLHGVHDLPAKQHIDVALIYGDYYFVEAVLRARALEAPAPVPSTGEPPAAGPVDVEKSGGCSSAPGPAVMAFMLASALLRRRRRAG
jgi:unsaturated chondroitin disaccharide hydrolase